MPFAKRPQDNPEREGLPSSVQVFESSADVTIAAESGVMIQVWRGRPSVASFDRIDNYFGVLGETYSRYAALIIMETGNTAPPDAAARQRAADMVKTRERELAGIGYVIEGTSLKLNMLRFTLSTVSLLSPSSVPQPVFASVSEGCAWLTSALSHVSPAEIERLVTQLRVQSRL
jgi:hypothetical protein